MPKFCVTTTNVMVLLNYFAYMCTIGRAGDNGHHERKESGQISETRDRGHVQK